MRGITKRYHVFLVSLLSGQTKEKSFHFWISDHWIEFARSLGYHSVEKDGVLPSSFVALTIPNYQEAFDNYLAKKFNFDAEKDKYEKEIQAKLDSME